MGRAKRDGTGDGPIERGAAWLLFLAAVLLVAEIIWVVVFVAIASWLHDLE